LGEGLGRAARRACADLRVRARVDIVTIAKPAPSVKLPIRALVPPDEFAELKALRMSLGFRTSNPGPLVASSYPRLGASGGSDAHDGHRQIPPRQRSAPQIERPPEMLRPDAAHSPLRGKADRGVRPRQDSAASAICNIGQEAVLWVRSGVEGR